MASIKLQGDNSGTLTIEAPSDAGNNTITLPATTQTLATQNALGVRNLIINGDMRIDQRNAGSAVSFGYIVDRFVATGNGFDEVVRSYQQVSDAPNDFDYSCKLTVTTAETAFTDNEHIGFAQRIEGQNVAHLQWGTSNAKTVTLSFWVKSSLTGTFSGMFQNSARDRSYPFEYTISSANTWEYKTVTVSGDTTGTWLKDNGIGIRVNFNHGCGPDRKGTANTWAGADYRASSTQTVELCENLNATWQITGVQLEVGDTATPFEHRPYDMELARCQRYYEHNYNIGQTPGSVSTYPSGMGAWLNGLGTHSGQKGFQSDYKVTKRATPSVTFYDTAGNSARVSTLNSGGTTTTNQSIAIVMSGTSSILGVAGDGSHTGVHYFWVADSEL